MPAGPILADPTTARKLYTGSVPAVDVTVVPDDEIAHIAESPVGVDRKSTSASRHHGADRFNWYYYWLQSANDSQIPALLNYILLTGDEARFKKFISQLTRRMPQHRERIMTIAERIYNDGWLSGMEKGRRRGTAPPPIVVGQRQILNG
ncbi:hypothetical protein ACNKHP_17400 [Shigella boydii]